MRRFWVGSALLTAPQVAWAQRVPGVAVVLALVPVINIVLACWFAIARRSVRGLLLHVGLAVGWLISFWLFASYTSSDFLAWLPVGLSAAHSLWLGYGILTGRARRQPSRSPDNEPPTPGPKV